MIDIDYIVKHTQALNVLYVEDNKDAREMTTMILEDVFNTITIACDGENGFEKFKQNHIDLIITDINMPKLSGPQMIKKIREIDKDIPILVFSAYDESDLSVEEIKPEIEAFILKPIDIEQFFDTLRKVIQKRFLVNETI